VRNLALTSLEEEIGVADAERGLPQFARRSAETDLSLDLPLRRRAKPSSEPTSSTTSQGERSIARVAERSGLERTHLYRKLKRSDSRRAKRRLIRICRAIPPENRILGAGQVAHLSPKTGIRTNDITVVDIDAARLRNLQDRLISHRGRQRRASLGVSSGI